MAIFERINKSADKSVIVKEYTDNEIIECLRTRQSYVVKWLSERYLPMIRLMVYQNGGSVEDARDIFQEGLMIMLEKIDSNDFVLTCKFKTFLFVVCENLWKSLLNKKKAATNYLYFKSEEVEEPDFTELQDNKIYEEIFYNVFATLEPVSQTILKYYWQELPPKEIAEKMGFTYGYVRKKKCEAQAELIMRIKNRPEYKKMMSTEKVI